MHISDDEKIEFQEFKITVPNYVKVTDEWVVAALVEQHPAFFKDPSFGIDKYGCLHQYKKKGGVSYHAKFKKLNGSDSTLKIIILQSTIVGIPKKFTDLVSAYIETPAKGLACRGIDNQELVYTDSNCVSQDYSGSGGTILECMLSSETPDAYMDCSGKNKPKQRLLQNGVNGELCFPLINPTVDRVNKGIAEVSKFCDYLDEYTAEYIETIHLLEAYRYVLSGGHSGFGVVTRRLDDIFNKATRKDVLALKTHFKSKIEEKLEVLRYTGDMSVFHSIK